METSPAIHLQKRRRRIKLNDTDVKRGDPAQLLMGRDERPARRHAPLLKKPPAQVKRTPRQIERDQMAKDTDLINELQQYAMDCEDRAAAAWAAVRCLEGRGGD